MNAKKTADATLGRHSISGNSQWRGNWVGRHGDIPPRHATRQRMAVIIRGQIDVAERPSAIQIGNSSPRSPMRELSTLSATPNEPGPATSAPPGCAERLGRGAPPSWNEVGFRGLYLWWVKAFRGLCGRVGCSWLLPEILNQHLAAVAGCGSRHVAADRQLFVCAILVAVSSIAAMVFGDAFPGMLRVPSLGCRIVLQIVLLLIGVALPPEP